MIDFYPEWEFKNYHRRGGFFRDYEYVIALVLHKFDSSLMPYIRQSIIIALYLFGK